MPVLLGPPKTARAEHLFDAGRLHESVEAWQDALALLDSLGMTSYASTVLIQLGMAKYGLGERAEAERLAVEGEELGAAEDTVNFSRGRRLRAFVAADRGDLEEAEALARDALAYAYRTDFPDEHGGAHEALGYVHAAAGRMDEARAEYVRAAEAWEQFDWIAKAARVRALLEEL